MKTRTNSSALHHSQRHMLINKMSTHLTSTLLLGALGCTPTSSSSSASTASNTTEHLSTSSANLGTLEAALRLPERGECHTFTAYQADSNDAVFSVDVERANVHNHRYSFLQGLPAGAYDLKGELDCLSEGGDPVKYGSLHAQFEVEPAQISQAQFRFFFDVGSDLAGVDLDFCADLSLQQLSPSTVACAGEEIRGLYGVSWLRDDCGDVGLKISLGEQIHDLGPLFRHPEDQASIQTHAPQTAGHYEMRIGLTSHEGGLIPLYEGDLEVIECDGRADEAAADEPSDDDVVVDPFDLTASKEAIDHSLALIRRTHLADGAFRMNDDGNLVWIVPYFGNQAALALLTASHHSRNNEDLLMVKEWLYWYKAHQVDDSGIYDQEGVVGDYTVRIKDGKKWVDAEDSASSTYLMVLSLYTTITGDVDILDDFAESIQLNYTILAELIDPSDDLSIAKSDDPIKYLGDNLETYYGLKSAVSLFNKLNLPDDANSAQLLLDSNGAALSRYWDSDLGYYGWAIDENGVLSIGIDSPYPEHWANLFAATTIKNTPTTLWTTIESRLDTTAHQGWTYAPLVAENAGASHSQVRTLVNQVRAFGLQLDFVGAVYMEQPAQVIQVLGKLPELLGPINLRF